MCVGSPPKRSVEDVKGGGGGQASASKTCFQRNWTRRARNAYVSTGRHARHWRVDLGAGVWGWPHGMNFYECSELC